MADFLTPDLCIIGGGAGGLAAAAEALSFGATVLIVEKAEMGGNSLFAASVPGRALIAAGRSVQSMRDAARFGVLVEEPKLNFNRLYDHVHGVVGSIAPNDSIGRYRGMGAEVINAEARFVDKKTLAAGDQLIRARRFIIATGSSAGLPAIAGIESVKVFTNETIFDETRRPSQLIIIGAGPVGLELGQAWHRLGAQVTILESHAPLGREDPELSAVVLNRMALEGLDIRSDVTVTEIAPRGHGIAVAIDTPSGSEVLAGSHLMVAAGRMPNLAGLNLDAAGIRYTPEAIRTDNTLKTSNRKVFAIGDVAGGARYSHAAAYEGRIAVRNALFGIPQRLRREIIPHVVYTDPEIATVGLTEPEARRRRLRNFRVLRWSYAENDAARTARTTEGVVKVLVDDKGRLLGASIAGPDAGEQIALYAFAMSQRVTADALADFVPAYPTLAEMARRIGLENRRSAVPDPWRQRLLKLMRRLP